MECEIAREIEADWQDIIMIESKAGEKKLVLNFFRHGGIPHVPPQKSYFHHGRMKNNLTF